MALQPLQSIQHKIFPKGFVTNQVVPCLLRMTTGHVVSIWGARYHKIVEAHACRVPVGLSFAGLPVAPVQKNKADFRKVETLMRWQQIQKVFEESGANWLYPARSHRLLNWSWLWKETRFARPASIPVQRRAPVLPRTPLCSFQAASQVWATTEQSISTAPSNRSIQSIPKYIQ